MWFTKTISFDSLCDKTRNGKKIIIKKQEKNSESIMRSDNSKGLCLQYFHMGKISEVDMYWYLRGNLDNDYEVLTPQEAISIVRKDRIDELIRRMVYDDDSSFVDKALKIRQQHDFDSYISCLERGEAFSVKPFSSKYHVIQIPSNNSVAIGSETLIGLQSDKPYLESEIENIVRENINGNTNLKPFFSGVSSNYDFSVRAIPEDKFSIDVLYTLRKEKDLLKISNSIFTYEKNQKRGD